MVTELVVASSRRVYRVGVPCDLCPIPHICMDWHRSRATAGIGTVASRAIELEVSRIDLSNREGSVGRCVATNRSDNDRITGNHLARGCNAHNDRRSIRRAVDREGNGIGCLLVVLGVPVATERKVIDLGRYLGCVVEGHQVKLLDHLPVASVAVSSYLRRVAVERSEPILGAIRRDAGKYPDSDICVVSMNRSNHAIDGRKPRGYGPLNPCVRRVVKLIVNLHIDENPIAGRHRI